MSEQPKTETFDRLRKFMAMTADERDEALFLQSERFKSLLDSEGIRGDLRQFCELMNGTTKQAGLPVRLLWVEQRVEKLVKSINALQRAMYICLGAYLATKFCFEFIAPMIHK